MDFDLFFFLFPQELTIYIEELVLALSLPHAGLACKVVHARAVSRDSIDFIIEMKPRPRHSSSPFQ